MGVRIIQIDLAQPLPTVAFDGSPANLRLLVTCGPQPIGWLRVAGGHERERKLAPERLARLVVDQLGANVLTASGPQAPEPRGGARTPSASVVVTCTGRQTEALERQLRAIAALRHLNHEVIVVDSVPRTDAARVACAKFPFVRYAIDPRPGIAYARNTGWQLALHEIVAFVDADAAVDAHWLNALAANFNDRSVACATGLTLSTIDPRVALGFRRRTYAGGTWNTTFPLDGSRFGSGVNMAVRRATLEALGGFDVALGAGSVARGADDLDLFARVLRAGGSIVYDPCAICFADGPRVTSSQRRHASFDRGWSFAAYCTKHARDLELGNFAMPTLARRALRTLLRGEAPIELRAAELLGAVMGLRAYRRSLRKVRQDQAKFRQRGMVPHVVTGAGVPRRAAA